MFVLDSIPLMILLEVKLFVGRALARARGSRICGVEFRPIGIPSSERKYGLLRSSCYRILFFIAYHRPIDIFKKYKPFLSACVSLSAKKIGFENSRTLRLFFYSVI